MQNYAGKGKLVIDRKGNWSKVEKIDCNANIGTYNNKRYGNSYPTKYSRIHYANDGVHIVPDSTKKED